MDNNKKEIEEIAKVICLFCKEMAEENKCERGNNCYDWRLKEASCYYEQGIRKIDKDKIVLTKEELDEMLELRTTVTVQRLIDTLWNSKDVKKELQLLAKQFNFEIKE